MVLGKLHLMTVTVQIGFILNNSMQQKEKSSDKISFAIYMVSFLVVSIVCRYIYSHAHTHAHKFYYASVHLHAVSQ